MAQDPLRLKTHLGYNNRTVNSSVGKALDKTFHQVRRILGVLGEGKKYGMLAGISQCDVGWKS